MKKGTVPAVDANKMAIYDIICFFCPPRLRAYKDYLDRMTEPQICDFVLFVDCYEPSLQQQNNLALHQDQLKLALTRLRRLNRELCL